MTDVGEMLWLKAKTDNQAPRNRNEVTELGNFFKEATKGRLENSQKSQLRRSDEKTEQSAAATILDVGHGCQRNRYNSSIVAK